MSVEIEILAVQTSRSARSRCDESLRESTELRERSWAGSCARSRMLFSPSPPRPLPKGLSERLLRNAPHLTEGRTSAQGFLLPLLRRAAGVALAGRARRTARSTIARPLLRAHGPLSGRLSRSEKLAGCSRSRALASSSDRDAHRQELPIAPRTFSSCLSLSRSGLARRSASRLLERLGELVHDCIRLAVDLLELGVVRLERALLSAASRKVVLELGDARA